MTNIADRERTCRRREDLIVGNDAGEILSKLLRVLFTIRIVDSVEYYIRKDRFSFNVSIVFIISFVDFSRRFGRLSLREGSVTFLNCIFGNYFLHSTSRPFLD